MAVSRAFSSLVVRQALMVATLVTVRLTDAVAIDSASGIEVVTRLGTLRGDVCEAGPGRHYYSFRGIPYAKPPVGSLRLKNPVPAEPWSGVRESFNPPVCSQISIRDFLSEGAEISGEEDCLYLHVYTPTVEGSNLPVMVFFHGGGFAMGDPDFGGGSPLPLMTRDVVLVSLQYRLGLLGFLSTEDEVLPGNLGVKDQTLALRWVQDNICSFGGNPAKVTLFGQSAGGSSVHLQILSPSAAGLFQRAIMQSGNILCPWALRSDHRKMAAVVAHYLDCPGQTEALDSHALLACLQEAPVSKLVLAQRQGETLGYFPFYMVPRVDGDFLPDHPAVLLRDGRYNKVDIISGVNEHEGMSTAFTLVVSAEGQRLRNAFSALAPYVVCVDEEEAKEYLANRIFYHYLQTDQHNFSDQNAAAIERMGGDVQFNYPHGTVSLFHAKDEASGKKVFSYELRHRGQYSFADLYSKSPNKKWINHGDELQYLFNDVFGQPPLTRNDDLTLRDIMLRVWTNFAATGNPTPDWSLGFKWKPTTPHGPPHCLSLTPAASMKACTKVGSRRFLSELPTLQNMLLYPEKFGATDNVIDTSDSDNDVCL